MSACYERQRIRFFYPENWQITDEETIEWPRTVSVQSPSGGFWSLMMYQAGEEPAELANTVLSTMQEEYDSLESTEIEEVFDETEMAGYDMYFYCLDFVVNSRVLATRTADRTMVLVWQAEDKEFAKLEPVFRAITFSLFTKKPIGETN